jgi:peptidoglycan/LPS O-acetylase OafA/YrhL
MIGTASSSGFCNCGPWLAPSFERLRLTVPVLQRALAQILRVRRFHIVNLKFSSLAIAAQAHVTPPSKPGEPGMSGTPPNASTRLDLRGHLPALDGVRGLAILMVLLVHFVGNMLPTTGIERAIVLVTGYGSYGVDLFFVLSGFLITGILYDARNEPHYFPNFYMRRLLRIFPLYYGVLALLFLVVPLVPLLQGATLDHLVERQAWAWLYAVNIRVAMDGEWSLSYINHFWSLAVEEHFYFFWPLVVFLLARRPQALIAVSLAVSLSAMLARVSGDVMGLSWWTTGTLMPFRLDGLALGAFLAVTARQTGGLDLLARALPPVAAVLGGLLAFVVAWPRLVPRQWVEPVGATRPVLILMVLACLMVWALIAPKQSAISRFFHSRSMVFLGTYSYGLYVYHHFISCYLTTNRTELELARWLGSHGAAVALQAILGASASLAMAYLSYELFEKRFLRLKRLFRTAEKPAPRSPAVVSAAERLGERQAPACYLPQKGPALPV